MTRAIVLCYHRVFPGYHITPEVFHRQMCYVSQHCDCMSLARICEYSTVGSFSPNNNRTKVAITFDDGWVDNYVYAFPILRELGLHATIFVPSAYILEEQLVRPTLFDYWQGNISYSELFRGSDLVAPFYESWQHGSSQEFCSWRELEIMCHTGTVQVESHGVDHGYHFSSNKVSGIFDGNTNGRQVWLGYAMKGIPNTGMPVFPLGSALCCPSFSPDPEFAREFRGKRGGVINQLRSEEIVAPGIFESNEQYANRVLTDLVDSKRRIESVVGAQVNFLAWPFGEFSSCAANLAKQAGYSASFSMSANDIRCGQAEYVLGRFGVPRRDFLFKSLLSSTSLNAYRLLLKVI